MCGCLPEYKLNYEIEKRSPRCHRAAGKWLLGRADFCLWFFFSILYPSYRMRLLFIQSRYKVCMDLFVQLVEIFHYSYKNWTFQRKEGVYIFCVVYKNQVLFEGNIVQVQARESFLRFEDFFISSTILFYLSILFFRYLG